MAIDPNIYQQLQIPNYGATLISGLEAGGRMAANRQQREAQAFKLSELADAAQREKDMQQELSSLTPEQINDPVTMQKLRLKYDPKSALEVPKPVEETPFVKNAKLYQSLVDTNKADTPLGVNLKAWLDKETAKNDSKGSSYIAPVDTDTGIYEWDYRTGKYKPAIDPSTGKTLIKSSSSPSLQSEIAGAKKTGALTAESRTKALIDMPKNIQEAHNVTKLVDDLLADPGLKQAVGKSSMLGVQFIPGTEAKSFMTRLNQIKGKQFLQAYETLKGGGQITEVEGKKATEAMSRMDNANTEDDFVKAAGEFKEIIQQGVDRAILKAKGGQEDAEQQAYNTLPNPREYDGKIARDTVSGKRYKSNGTTWILVK